ncbi:MAG: hypothetical protein H6Q17_334 [Bacteroidetes bacterium]|nr:hypothetical protein [Bacteroidota bacterium]
MIGYNSKFIGDNLEVKFPQFTAAQSSDIAPCADDNFGEYKYLHHSIFLSKKRKFPYFTATNINGTLIQSIKRNELFDGGSDKWEMDKRGVAYQFGSALYSAEGSDFEKGHMTKREDPQWGETIEIARKAAQSTFFYTNCVPQVKELNGVEWRKLETYILNKVAKPENLLISVFTGPVLLDSDPLFITNVEGQSVKLPKYFWKIVYYSEDGESLKRVGFLMGQSGLLEKKKIVVSEVEKSKRLMSFKTQAFFEGFEDAATFQVSISSIEELTGLKFHPAKEPYTTNKSTKLILSQVNIKVEAKMVSGLPIEYEFENIRL